MAGNLRKNERKFFSTGTIAFFTELPGEPVESITVYARSLIGGPAMVLYGCRTLFSIVHALEIFYYDPHHLEKCLKIMCIISQPLLCDHETSRLGQKLLMK